MATTAAAQRKFDLENLEEETQQLEKEIVEGEFAERLAHNADWALLEKFYRADLATRTQYLDGMKQVLMSTPMGPNEAIAHREHVMLLERDRANAEDFLGFPKRMSGLLKDMRERANAAREEIKKMKGGHRG